MFDNAMEELYFQKRSIEDMSSVNVEDAPQSDSQNTTIQEESPLLAGHNELFTLGKENLTPFVYICATMWHETPDEMNLMLKSLLR